MKGREGRDVPAHPRCLVLTGLLHSLLILLFMICCRDSAVCHPLGGMIYLGGVPCTSEYYFSPNVLKGLG